MKGNTNPQYGQEMDGASYELHKLAHSFLGLIRSRDVNKRLSKLILLRTGRLHFNLAANVRIFLSLCLLSLASSLHFINCYQAIAIGNNSYVEPEDFPKIQIMLGMKIACFLTSTVVCIMAHNGINMPGHGVA
jgi:uncharacterized membrane protein